jgi:hypothetical protein
MADWARTGFDAKINLFPVSDDDIFLLIRLKRS